MNYVLAFENQKITLYANKKTTPSRDGYMITQIKRSFSLFATISFFAVCFRIHHNLFFYKNHPIKNVRFCWISINFSI